ncbi:MULTISPECIES: ABC transporter ATP-binding protein [Salinibaculum]|uniref:ABC transporter ATP-binding protein n=1 Tax=Salinibaculum TaxID=2732368 RepID=UPI0030CD40BD
MFVDVSRSIAVQNVSKSYSGDGGSLRVLDEVSFDIAGSEFVALLGPSGCGKTTLLKILAGTVSADVGEIYAGETRLTGPSPDIAMVFQDFHLLPWKSVLENVRVGIELQSASNGDTGEAVASEWLRKVGLEGVADSYPSELSGGMKQRVGLARALAVDPDVLLMDEPFGALDAQTKDRLQTELLELWNAQQKTILFVTHDIDEAIYLADRVLVLSEKPATIVDEVEVPFERPRWKRRVDIEGSSAFNRIKSRLRDELGLSVE